MQEVVAASWLASGERPDRHPAVRPYSEMPPSDGDFEIMSIVEVRDGWTDLRSIQCNVCKNQHKFRSKGYWAAYSNGWWYIVGPDCGAEEFQRKFTQALNRNETRLVRRIAEGRVGEFLKNLDAWRSFYASLSLAVAEVDRGQRFLATKMPTLYRHLDDARRQDGALHRVQKRRVVNARGGSHEEDDFVPHGRISGTSAIARPCAAVLHFRSVPDAISRVLKGDPIEPIILESNSKGTIALLQNQIATMQNEMARAHNEVMLAKLFWRDETWRQIAEWAKRRDTRYDLEISYSWGAGRLQIVTELGGSRNLDLTALVEYGVSLPPH